MSRHGVAGDMHRAQGTRGGAGQWRFVVRYGTQHPFTLRTQDDAPVSTTSIASSQTRTGRRPAEGLRHSWKGDVARRPFQEAAARDTPRWGAAAPAQGVRTQHERMRLTQGHNTHVEEGTRKLIPATAPASGVGPHGGGSETQGAPGCAAGREPENSTGGDGAFAPQQGGQCHSALTACPEYTHPPWGCQYRNPGHAPAAVAPGVHTVAVMCKKPLCGRVRPVLCMG
jgi:hypothetical protein